MSNVKTAISLQSELFQQVEEIAREMNISRSRLFALALEEFIRHHQNRQLLEQINAAYADDEPDAAEQAAQHGMRRHQRRIVEGQW
jgi:metal-responsive CopG/Arc/MetJ family transcriptional regulator